MLTKLYAHNYRCFVNFEITFEPITLLLGPNGGGKSSLFDLLYNIQRLVVAKDNIKVVFPPHDLTAWITHPNQNFELEVSGPSGLYSYKLIISHNPDLGKQRIELESLTLDGKPLFEFHQGEVKLYNDEHRPGPEYSFDWSISALAHIVERRDNRKLSWFKRWLEGLFILNLQPQAMTSISQEESFWLERHGANFASWYRYMSQENQDKIFHLTDQLRKYIPGFHGFKLESAGNYRILKVGFTDEHTRISPFFFDFDKLSDGQRVLIILYTLLIILKNQGYTLFLDEPENYVSLPEIQPWLMELQDGTGEGFNQVVLISHHPELIDYLGYEYGVRLERDPLGPTRVRKPPTGNDAVLKLSEKIALGWTE